jgi:uncharacterized protein YheU (UPF0270 family)
MIIPHNSLKTETLAGIVEEFVLREGTEYGVKDFSLAAKVAQVYKQLERGDVVVVFDTESETCDIVPKTSSRFRELVSKVGSAFALALLPVLAATLSACSVQMFSGEDVPDEEAALLAFRRSGPELIIDTISVDAKSVPTYATSVKLLPGEHLVTIRYRIELRDFCDARDYMCPSTILQGRCEGALDLQMGSRGVVVMDSRSGEVRAQLELPRILGPLSVSDGKRGKSIPCTRPSRYDSVGRAGITS